MGTIVETSEDARRLRRERPGALLIALAEREEAALVQIRIDVADPGLRCRVEAALRGALAAASREPPRLVVWKMSTLRRARALGVELAGALAVIRAREGNAGRLRRLVALVEGYGAAGLQIVCRGEVSARLEQVIFRILEERRGQPGRPPLVLASTEEPVEVLLRSLEVGR